MKKSLFHYCRRPAPGILPVALVLLLLPAIVQAGGWQQLETRYAIVKYKGVDSLESFANSIDFGPGGGLFSSFSSSDAAGLNQGLKRKVDAVFRKAQEILDMPKRIARVTIELHPDTPSLHRRFRGLTGRQCRVRAWYIYEMNTVYLNAEDIHEGILAHELAHAIIDNYLSVRPPRATAEILARYVDAHLHD
jgi:hypothetical protein